MGETACPITGTDAWLRCLGNRAGIALSRKGPLVDETEDQRSDFLASMTQIVAAHLANANTSLPTENVPAFMRDVYEAIRTVENDPKKVAGDAPASPELKPAVAIEQSVSPEYIVCLEDGKHLKMLKRHLMSRYQMTPADYRLKWNLPADYPMVAPAYAERRAVVAREIGLGRRIRTETPAPTLETIVKASPPAVSTAVEPVLPSRAPQEKSRRSTVKTGAWPSATKKKPASSSARARKSKPAAS